MCSRILSLKSLTHEVAKSIQRTNKSFEESSGRLQEVKTKDN